MRAAIFWLKTKGGGNVSDAGSAIRTWTANVTYNFVPLPRDIIEKAARLKSACDRHNVPLKAAAIQFPLHHPAIASVLMGPRTPRHVDDNVEAFTETTRGLNLVRGMRRQLSEEERNRVAEKIVEQIERSN